MLYQKITLANTVTSIQVRLRISVLKVIRNAKYCVYPRLQLGNNSIKKFHFFSRGGGGGAISSDITVCFTVIYLPKWKKKNMVIPMLMFRHRTLVSRATLNNDVTNHKWRCWWCRVSTVYIRIFCRKLLTLSSQTSLYNRKRIQISFLYAT